MNRTHQRSVSVIFLLIISLATSTLLHAGNATRSSAQQYLTGEFLGYDQKSKKIWINDYAYILSATCRIVGTPTKLGLLSSIKYEEVVKFKTAPNQKQPSIPYVIEIRRK